jgi:hypothetical protein
MIDWARKEVEFAIKELREDTNGDNSMDGYIASCYRSALKAFYSLCEDGHSGMSIGVTKNILNGLISGRPLTPIKEDDDCWEYLRDVDDCRRYQCSRMSSLFKDAYYDGTIKYDDVDRFLCSDITNLDSYFHSGLVDEVLGEMLPLKLPYSGERIKVFCSEILTDSKHGDFDTVAILYYINEVKTDNYGTISERVDVYRFFKESDERGKYGYWEEISREEWNERCIMAELREQEIQKNIRGDI